MWWLEGISPQWYSVVRCPRHITDWAMRQAGYRRTKKSYQWRRLGQEHDRRSSVQESLYSPFFHPDDVQEI